MKNERLRMSYKLDAALRLIVSKMRFVRGCV